MSWNNQYGGAPMGGMGGMGAPMGGMGMGGMPNNGNMQQGYPNMPMGQQPSPQQLQQMQAVQAQQMQMMMMMQAQQYGSSPNFAMQNQQPMMNAPPMQNVKSWPDLNAANNAAAVPGPPPPNVEALMNQHNAPQSEAVKPKANQYEQPLQEQKQAEEPISGSGIRFELHNLLKSFRLDSKEIVQILDNVEKQNLGDTDFKSIDANDDKLLAKLIPDTKEKKYDEVRRRVAAFLRYDSKAVQDDEKLPQQEEVVTLNIGGFLYTTMKSTLLASDSTYFRSLFKLNLADERNKYAVDKDNNYFIDRNGRLFEPILRYLHSNELEVPINEWYTVHDVFDEMRFFDLQLPAQFDRSDERYLPESFRFEYAGKYNNSRQFCVNRMRIKPAAEAESIAKKIKDFPQEDTLWQDPQRLLALRLKLAALGYQLKDTQTFRGNPHELNWTYVEFYQRIRWKRK